jgi:hypothetical protein
MGRMGGNSGRWMPCSRRNPRNRIVGARRVRIPLFCALRHIPKVKKICLYFSRSCRVVRVAIICGGSAVAWALVDELGLSFLALLRLAVTLAITVHLAVNLAMSPALDRRGLVHSSVVCWCWLFRNCV